MRLTEPQVYRPEDRSQKQGRDLPVLPPPRRGCSASPSAVRASLVEGWELTQEREAVRQNRAEGGHGGVSSENAPGIPASPALHRPCCQHATFEQKFLAPEGDLQN